MLNLNLIRGIFDDLGPKGFTHRFRQMLGIEDPATGKPRINPKTQEPVLESAILRPEHCSLKALYHGLVGYDDGEKLMKGAGYMIDVNESDVLEDGGTSIVPSAFANVSAYNAAALGLLEAKFLEVYRRPTFISEQLAETVPTNKIQEKFIGISSVGDVAEERKPGDRHMRVNVSERYVTTPSNVNRAVAVDVTREAVMFDRTRELLTQAEKSAEVLALRKEYIVLDTFLGINNTYTYNGTNYNTYGTSGNWVNDQTNVLIDWTQINAALQLFSAMSDQETGQPIDVEPHDILTMPATFLTARGILRYTEIQRRTNNTAEIGIGANPLGDFQFNLVGSPTYPYAMRRATAADGLNLSLSEAQAYWWIGDFRRAFVYTQNLPLTIQRATASEYEMTDRGLVFSMFADEMGNCGVRDPRFVVRNHG